MRAALCAALVATLGAPAWAATPSSGAGSRDAGASGPLHVIGHLPEPTPNVDRAGAGHIAQIDAAGRRMYYVYTNTSNVAHVVTYDLRPKIPQPIADGVLANTTQVPQASPNVVALDTKRHHLVFVGTNVSAGGQVVPTLTPTALVFDTVHNKALPQWDLAATLPGFFIFGITYSQADDRLYALGEFSGGNPLTANWGFGSKVAGPVTTVVALNPANGDVDWIHPIPECQQALYTLNVGSLIARSSLRPALYFACVTGAVFTRQTYPGEAGVVQLNIDPKATSPAGAATFSTDFFPISGQYFNGAGEGFASFDHRTDRLFLQSLAAATPGAWVFDGRLSAWVGFISSPDITDSFAGFNEGLGRLYMGLNGQGTPLKTDGIVVADGRQTPVPSGTFQRIVAASFIPTDAGSNRLFVLTPGSLSAKLEPYLVVEDRSPKSVPLGALDYDQLTDGVSEKAASFITYSADVNAYGADVALVGGLAGPMSISGNLDLKPPVAGGSRGLMTARLTGIGLRPAGASASAQSITTDLNTTQDYQNNGHFGAWPYPVVSCLDSGGGVKPESTDSNGSQAATDCSLQKARAHGEANAAAIAAGPLRVGHSTSNATTWRDALRGAETSADASSSGITVDLPGTGQLHIGSVAAHLTARAHGAVSTSAATYQRNVTGIEIVDPTGKVLFGPAACATTLTAVNGAKPVVKDSCGPIAHQINAITQTRLHLGFPLPESFATPKGAYAAIQQSDPEYYQERTVDDQGVIYPHDSTSQRPTPAMQIVVYNDTTERSRLVAQFAGVQGDAIFDTTAALSSPQSPPPGSAPGPKAPQQPPATTGNHPGRVPGGGTTTTTPGTPGQPPTLAAPATGLTGWLFIHRGVRDALLLAGILALAAGAGLLAARRQRLLTAMTASTGRPSS